LVNAWAVSGSAAGVVVCATAAGKQASAATAIENQPPMVIRQPLETLETNRRDAPAPARAARRTRFADD
jgi:hypothetical protein